MIFITVFFPFLTKELVESHPEKAWIPRRALHFGCVCFKARSVMLMICRWFPTPVSRYTVFKMVKLWYSNNRKTSVSEALTMMALAVGQEAA